ncbi:hypothetical protein NLM33_45735 [Bradyrhizobium sp. CCGUVB1N3]|uniref:hypothetical protein n=1 Tax=Bradyrhizobium sp. CCGUVB1N3 TaxID=2949629 RepID=UPI0020B38F2E|nr:hypothetical protein [Bradyrhizobium sp. CCGUVB1N3]MCP3477465.1 hypothetical protein [Bradyrhizobium sp. CCGUVB1N3]
MSIDELLEKHRTEQLAYMRTRLAVIDSNIARYKKDVETWSEPTTAFTEAEQKEILESFKGLLEGAEREREYYRARLASYEGFNLVRPDVH